MSSGKRGPKPKPTALRVFEGDPGHLLGKREGEVMPEIVAEIPKPPDWLGDIGKAKWGEVAPALFRIGCLTVVDVNLLALYCEAWDEFFAARAEIEKSGIVAMSDKGAEYQHPAVGIKNKAIQRIKQLGGEFGMSPASRVGLTVNNPNRPSGLAAFKAKA
jgi:P27 family predicted phage terminase small subunit